MLNDKLQQAGGRIHQLEAFNSNGTLVLQQKTTELEQRDQECKDLSLQVTSLLKAVNRLERGLPVQTPPAIMHESQSIPLHSSAEAGSEAPGQLVLHRGEESDLVSRNLVHVLSIEHMQQNNQHLLREVRQLQDERNDLRSRLAGAREELQAVSRADARLKQAEQARLMLEKHVEALEHQVQRQAETQASLAAPTLALADSELRKRLADEREARAVERAHAQATQEQLSKELAGIGSEKDKLSRELATERLSRAHEASQHAFFDSQAKRLCAELSNLQAQLAAKTKENDSDMITRRQQQDSDARMRALVSELQDQKRALELELAQKRAELTFQVTLNYLRPRVFHVRLCGCDAG